MSSLIFRVGLLASLRLNKIVRRQGSIVPAEHFSASMQVAEPDSKTRRRPAQLPWPSQMYLLREVLPFNERSATRQLSGQPPHPTQRTCQTSERHGLATNSLNRIRVRFALSHPGSHLMPHRS